MSQKAERGDVSLNEWMIGYLLEKGEMTEEELKKLTTIQMQLVRSAQKSKNELRVNLEKDIKLFEKLTWAVFPEKCKLKILPYIFICFYVRRHILMFAKCWPLYYIDNRKWKHLKI